MREFIPNVSGSNINHICLGKFSKGLLATSTLSLFRYLVIVIGLSRSGEKMIGAHAERRVASMKSAWTVFWQRAIVKLVREAVCPLGFPVYVQLSISVLICRRSPQPACPTFTNVFPESLNRRLGPSDIPACVGTINSLSVFDLSVRAFESNTASAACPIYSWYRHKGIITQCL